RHGSAGWSPTRSARTAPAVGQPPRTGSQAGGVRAAGIRGVRVRGCADGRGARGPRLGAGGVVSGPRRGRRPGGYGGRGGTVVGRRRPRLSREYVKNPFHGDLAGNVA